jgi:type I restriction enzyme, S subunit
MKPYPTYRPSGVPWLGDLPAHWHVKKAKYIAPIVGEKADGAGAGTRYVGLEHVEAGTGQFVDFVDGMQTDAESTVNVFAEGDVLFGKLRPYLAKSVVADSDGVCSSEFLVLRPEDGIDARFLNRSLLLDGVIETIDASTYGAKMPRADWTFISQLGLPLPSFDEQRAIADFLDIETTRIGELIREKEGLIDLLHEARQSFVSGLLSGDAKAGSRSGNEWIPYLPDGWQIKRLKHLAQVRSGIAKGKDTEGRETVELPYLRVANVQDGHLDLDEVSTIEVELSAVERFSLQPGDVLMNEGGDYDKLGRGALWSGEVSPCLHQNHVFAVRPVEEDLSEWIAAITQTKYAKFYFMNNAKQSTNLASISQTNVKELPVLLPPKKVRQELLARAKREAKAIAELVAHTRDEIGLLKELRAATIADAVLGRVDVRTRSTSPV